MAISAPKPCNHPGCGVLVRDGSGRCERHRKTIRKVYDDHRGSSAERGYDSRWQKARAGFLRSHPLCVECERNGRVTAATVVDHIIPHRGDKALFWNHDNWQPLCKRCHDSVKQREELAHRRSI